MMLKRGPLYLKQKKKKVGMGFGDFSPTLTIRIQQAFSQLALAEKVHVVRVSGYTHIFSLPITIQVQRRT